MACLTIADLYLQQLDSVVGLIGVSVTYYPVVLEGYSTSSHVRSPSEATAVSVDGIFGEERVTGIDGAITHVTTFTISSAAYAGTPSPGDRIVYGDVSYRVIEMRRTYFGAILTNYVLTIGN